MSLETPGLGLVDKHVVEHNFKSAEALKVILDLQYWHPSGVAFDHCLESQICGFRSLLEYDVCTVVRGTVCRRDPRSFAYE
eukprot:6201656-Pleurochrysis_carterae.AAC.2